MASEFIRTNIGALNSHRNLKTVNTQQSKTSQRLSSGLRINSAADDAAGLGISEKMRAQIRGLDQAFRNCQDGISLIRTAEGGIATINEMLVRMRELVVQAANDTNVHDNANLSQSDRMRVQDELNQLIAEIDATANRVQFNTRTLLSGNYARAASASASSIVLPSSQQLIVGLLEQFSKQQIKQLEAVAGTSAVIPMNTPPNAVPERTINLNTGLNVDGNASGDGWHFANGVLNITGSGDFQINGTGAATTNRIVVTSSANIGLNNVNINANVGAAFQMHGVEVNLTLEGENTLITNATSRAGLETSANSVLTINAADTYQRLNARGGASVGQGAGAGIGGAGTAGVPGHTGPAGRIVIENGWINATGGAGSQTFSGAGIGGGGLRLAGEAYTSAGEVIVRGGIVMAVGGWANVPPNNVNGAGIGGGHFGGGVDLTIEGGLVEIGEGSWIGAGNSAAAHIPHGTITITGGNLAITAETGRIRSVVRDENGRELFNTQVFFFVPGEIEPRVFPAHTEMEYTLDGETISAITDSLGRLFMYLPGSLADPNNYIGVFDDGGTLDPHLRGWLLTQRLDGTDRFVFGPPITLLPDTTERTSVQEGYLTFESTNPGEYFFIVRPAGGSPPTVQELINEAEAAGQRITGASGGQHTITFDNFPTNGAYDVFIIKRDEINPTEISNMLRMTIPSYELNIREHSVVRNSESDATIQFDSDRSGRYFFVVRDSDAPLSAHDIMDAADRVMVDNANDGRHTINLSNLMPGQKYIFIVKESTSGSLISNVIRVTIPEYVENEDSTNGVTPDPPTPPSVPTTGGGPLWFQTGANINQGVHLYIEAMDALALGLTDIYDNPIINVMRESGEDIHPLLTILDDALFIVLRERSNLGAMQNRLEYTMENVDVASENLSAANSRIRDADMAKEMMRLTQANVLQQAATTMLAQANQAPQAVLQLLQE